MFPTFRSKKLLENCTIFMCLFLLISAKTTNRPDIKNVSTSEPLKSAASEKIEKILNVPVNLKFEEEPLIRRGRGFYGGHRRNDEAEEQKINDSQFGARIILGIIEHPHETTTPVIDQKKSQTIVKYFDKEDYGGIKTNPIVVEDNYEDADQIENTRKRKELPELKQEESPLVDEEQPQKNEDYTNEDEEIKEEAKGTENDDYVKENNEEYEGDDVSEKQQDETVEDPNKYIKKHDNIFEKYKERKIPPNHKDTYTEIDYPDIYEHKNEERSDKLKYQEEEKETEDSPGKYIHHEEEKATEENPGKYTHHEETAKASDMKESLSHKDQKESADHSHEEVKKKKKKSGKHASGKGEEHHEEHHGKKGDKGLKEYKGFHEEVKKKKGHHDEEKHGKKYADKGGEEKKHHEEYGHHGNHLKGEKGEKESEFSEEGKHSKGHSTKGEHNIHKKDEYEKKQEFYDEHHEGGEHEKHGGFHHEDQYKKGGHKKIGHHKKGDHEDHYGKKSHHEQGHFYDDKDGKKKSSGHNLHHSHHSKHGKKVDNSGKKHWGYKKGTGGGGHKKHKEGQQVAHSNLRQIKKAPPTVHNHYREENNKYPHYIGRIHVHNDNRRIDTVDGDIINQKLNNTNEKEEENHQIYSDTKENEEQNAQPVISNEKNDEKLEETDSDYLPQSSILLERNRESPKNTSKPLPKIYVILPKDFEEQLQQSAETSSIEKESSYEDSEEETEPNFRTVHKKYTKVIEPVEAQSFPEEHKKKLTEIEYVIHKIGAELGKNLKDKKSKKKPVDDEISSKEFNINGSSED